MTRLPPSLCLVACDPSPCVSVCAPVLPVSRCVTPSLPVSRRVTRSGLRQAALKLPRATEEEAAARKAALQAGLRSAVAVPLGLQRRIHRLWEPLDQLAPLGNIATKSDLQVRTHMIAKRA